MKADFLAAFNALKDYLFSKIPELGNIIMHFDDPFLVSKNRTIMLPDAHTSADSRVTFSVQLFISTVEKNADVIAQTQMSIMEKVFEAIYGNIPATILSATINSADYFDPTPQSPNVGILHVIIEMTINYIDDCGGSDDE